ncbi:hypothetical protein D3C75_688700 [compost metagenome]
MSRKSILSTRANRNKQKTNKKSAEERKEIKEKVEKKLKKIRKGYQGVDSRRKSKVSPETEEKHLKIWESEQYKKIQEKYKPVYEYLDNIELYVLDAVLRGETKQNIAEELGYSVSGIYYIISQMPFQKAFQKEMELKFAVMQKTRKAMYVKIAEKSLNILMTMLEDLERDRDKYGITPAKIKDIVAIVDKVVSMMQDEDGTKGTNVNITGGTVNTNLNIGSEEAEKFNMADAEFRKHLASALVASKPKTPIV